MAIDPTTLAAMQDPAQHPLFSRDPGLLASLLGSNASAGVQTPAPPTAPQTSGYKPDDSVLQSALGLLGSRPQQGALSGLGGGVGSAPFVGGTGGDRRVVNIAKRFIGNPYVTGAEGEYAGGKRQFDCSGLVDFVLNKAGYNVPRLTANGYMNALQSVPKHQLQPGDPLYFWYPNSRGLGRGQASHVGIYVGNGRMIAAADPSRGVVYENVDWSHYIGASHLPGVQNHHHRRVG